MNNARRPSFNENEMVMPWQGHAATDELGVRLPILDLWRLRIAKALRAEFAATWAACSAFEWVALGYLGVSSAFIVIFGALANNLAHPGRWMGIQMSVAAVILILCRVEAEVAGRIGQGQEGQEERSAILGCPTFARKLWHFWRHWYPHLFFLFCFEELGHLVHLISSGWRDDKLIAFDHWLTGVHPAVWLEQFATPARNEFMQFAYLTYFLYLLVLGGILYYRRDWEGYWSVMTYSAAGYAIGYVIAIVFPIESPWFAMAGAWHGELRGGVCTAVINFIEHFGRVRGAAFPSEHVAGSFAALWGAWRHRRWLFWVMLPLVMCMCMSTVWGRYHYVADIFGGMITGTLGYLIGRWVMRKREEVDSRKLKVERGRFRE